MKKTTAKTLKILGLVLAALFFAILILELRGFRFDYTNVPDQQNLDKGHFIKTEDWVFHYFTMDVRNDKNEKVDEIIEGVLPIKKYGFLYRADYDYLPDYTVYTADINDYVGMLYCYKGKDSNHYFFHYAHYTESPLFSENWLKVNQVTINGKEHELFKNCFFSSKEEFTSFYFGECEVKLVPHEGE